MKPSSFILSLLSSSSAMAYKVHNVTIGLGGYSYSPNSVTADVGDYVRFEFVQGIHGVAQASFSQPCLPYSDSDEGNGTVGFFSGIISYVDTTENFVIRVNDTNPLWFYCPEAYHCQSGMVGAINPTAKQTLDDFTSSASSQSTNTAPSVVSGNTTVGDTTGLSASSGASSVSVTASSSTERASSSSSSALEASSSSVATTSATSTLVTSTTSVSSSAAAATSSKSASNANTVNAALMLGVIVAGAHALV